MSETLVGLVSRYSPSGEEETAVRWLVKHMKSLGYAESYTDEADNAVGVIGEGPRQVILLGHIDTVPGEIDVRLENDVLYGRGVVDAKGPLACFVDAAAACRVPRGWQVVVIGAVEEERDSVGAYYAADHYKPDFAIIGEPNRWDRVSLGYKGSAWVEINVHRDLEHTAGSASTACEIAVGLWNDILAMAESYNTDKTRIFDQLQPSLQGMKSEKSDFEQSAKIKIGVRLPPEVTPEEWYERLERIVAEGGQVERLGRPIAACTCDKNTRLVRALLAGIRGEGGTPAFVYKTGTADLNIVAPAWKCPAAVYGPGDSALDHTPHEMLDLEEYRKSVRVLTAALEKLMGEG